MENYNKHFVFDFADAVIIRESVGDICIGTVRSAQYDEEPSVTARIDGDKLAIDFVIPIPLGTAFVDSKMSDTSTNPVSNCAVKKYVDAKGPAMTQIFSDSAGKISYSDIGCLSKYDAVLCYANPIEGASPTSVTVPIKYALDRSANMDIVVSDSLYNTTFCFSSNGFYTKSYTGSTGGRIFAMYGIKM